MTMRPPVPALLATVTLVLAAAGLSACGASTRLLPAGAATQLDEQLQRASDATLAGDCSGADAALAEARRTFISLPSTIDTKLRTRIQSGLTSLGTSIPVQCRTGALPASGTDTTPAPGATGTSGATGATTPTPPTTPTTAPPSTTDTPPATTPSTTATTTPTTPQPPVGGASPGGGGTDGGG